MGSEVGCHAKRTVGGAPGSARTSSNGRVSLKQLSQASFTARAAVASSGHFGFARTDRIALRRTHACAAQNGTGNGDQGVEKGGVKDGYSIHGRGAPGVVW